jgi:outer membrane protein assembly factor BamB
MIVYCSSGGAVGVSAVNGKLFWEDPEWTIRTNVPSPLSLGDGRIFFTAGYNRGSRMIQVQKDGNGFAVQKLYELEADVFGAEQQTPIWYQGHIFGIRADEQLVCMNPNGNIVWTSGSSVKFGLGPFAIADGLIYALDDHGLLRMAEASVEGYKPLAEAQVLNGHDAWGPMAFASGRLIIRDLTKMVCLDISESSGR